MVSFNFSFFNQLPCGTAGNTFFSSAIVRNTASLNTVIVRALLDTTLAGGRNLYFSVPASRLSLRAANHSFLRAVCSGVGSVACKSSAMSLSSCPGNPSDAVSPQRRQHGPTGAPFTSKAAQYSCCLRTSCRTGRRRLTRIPSSLV